MSYLADTIIKMAGGDVKLYGHVHDQRLIEVDTDLLEKFERLYIVPGDKFWIVIWDEGNQWCDIMTMIPYGGNDVAMCFSINQVLKRLIEFPPDTGEEDG